MTHQICDACECVSHCRKNGCVPLTPMDQAPAVTSSTDPKYLREALDKTFELLVRERGIVKELAAALEPFTWFPAKAIESLRGNEPYTITMRGEDMQRAMEAFSKADKAQK